MSVSFCNIGFAENYFFKECKMGENYEGSFLIDIKKRTINRIFENTQESSVSEKTDKIKFVKNDQIVSEIIQSGTGSNRFFQYYLDAETDSVSIQKYLQDSGIGLLSPDGLKQKSYCKNVKADWFKRKTKKESFEEKKKKEFDEEQERERLKAKKEKLEKISKQAAETKTKKINQHNISISGEFFPAARPKRRLKSENKLKKDFITKAHEICLPYENFDILKQKIKVVGVGEATAFPKKGLVPGVQLGISGIIKCK